MSDEPKKIGLLDLLLVLLERKKIFILSMLLFSLGAVTYTLLATKYYRATAVILPPKQQLPSGLGSLVSDLPISGLLKSIDILGANNTDQFLSILQSRRLAEKAIDTFNLVKYYDFEGKKFFIEDVLKTFYKSVKTGENDFGNITIAVTDTSPKIAADIANFMVRELDKIGYELSKESARNSRMFFEERLEIIKSDLDSASGKFTEFQINNNYIDLEQQVKSSIDALAKVEAEKMAVDLQIEQLRSQFGTSSQRMRELQRTKSVIEHRLAFYMDSGSGDLIISLKQAPRLGIEYAHLLRDVKVQETLYKFALQMFEQSKFTEANNIPSVQVLEWAHVPQKRIKPKRALTCILVFFVGFVLTSIGLILYRLYEIERERSSPVYQKLRGIMRHLVLRA